jgi:hypothetical protein
MTTMAFTLVLNDSEAIALEKILNRVIAEIDSRRQMTDTKDILPFYYSHAKNIKARLYKRGEVTSRFLPAPHKKDVDL